MANASKSRKQLQIDKTNSSIVIVVSVAAVFIAFSLVSVKALLSQRSYQSRVITQQSAALKTAKSDLVAAKSLDDSYNSFNGKTTNIIGGSLSGSGPQDGTNTKIVLDALPSQYDFPSLVSSLEKFVALQGVKLESLSGTDDATQANIASSVSPVAVPIPFQFSVSGPYASIQQLTKALDRSILPIAIQTMELSGSDAATKLTVTANVSFQPAKNLNVTTKVVK
ncbi:hypothetical protein H7171_00900 [Candidatus Saccharibacteria bacterium]|nr:hypothetical protein [Candidatus Saccharibacteria bacterium]